jgi:hypothetical protein
MLVFIEFNLYPTYLLIPVVKVEGIVFKLDVRYEIINEPKEKPQNIKVPKKNVKLKTLTVAAMEICRFCP